LDNPADNCDQKLQEVEEALGGGELYDQSLAEAVFGATSANVSDMSQIKSDAVLIINGERNFALQSKRIPQHR